MTPTHPTARRRVPAEYSLLETVLLMAALSVLPLALLVAVSTPLVAVGGTTLAAGLAVGVPALRRLRADDREHAQVCVPGTEVCASV